MPNRLAAENLHWQRMFDDVMGDSGRRAGMAQNLSMSLAQVSTATILGNELAASGMGLTDHERKTLDTLDSTYPDTMTGFRNVVAVALNAQPHPQRTWLPRLHVEFDYSTSWPSRVEVTAELDHGRLSSVIVFPLAAYD